MMILIIKSVLLMLAITLTGIQFSLTIISSSALKAIGENLTYVKSTIMLYLIWLAAGACWAGFYMLTILFP